MPRRGSTHPEPPPSLRRRRSRRARTASRKVKPDHVSKVPDLPRSPGSRRTTWVSGEARRCAMASRPTSASITRGTSGPSDRISPAEPHTINALEVTMATRTLTAMFDTYAGGAEAVSRLEQAGIAHDDISIVSNDPAHQDAL